MQVFATYGTVDPSADQTGAYAMGYAEVPFIIRQTGNIGLSGDNYVFDSNGSVGKINYDGSITFQPDMVMYPDEVGHIVLYKGDDIFATLFDSGFVANSNQQLNYINSEIRRYNAEQSSGLSDVFNKITDVVTNPTTWVAAATAIVAPELAPAIGADLGLTGTAAVAAGYGAIGAGTGAVTTAANGGDASQIAQAALVGGASGAAGGAIGAEAKGAVPDLGTTGAAAVSGAAKGAITPALTGGSIGAGAAGGALGSALGTEIGGTAGNILGGAAGSATAAQLAGQNVGQSAILGGAQGATSTLGSGIAGSTTPPVDTTTPTQAATVPDTTATPDQTQAAATPTPVTTQTAPTTPPADQNTAVVVTTDPSKNIALVMDTNGQVNVVNTTGSIASGSTVAVDPTTNTASVTQPVNTYQPYAPIATADTVVSDVAPSPNVVKQPSVELGPITDVSTIPTEPTGIVVDSNSPTNFSDRFGNPVNPDGTPYTPETTVTEPTPETPIDVAPTIIPQDTSTVGTTPSRDQQIINLINQPATSTGIPQTGVSTSAGTDTTGTTPTTTPTLPGYGDVNVPTVSTPTTETPPSSISNVPVADAGQLIVSGNQTTIPNLTTPDTTTAEDETDVATTTPANATTTQTISPKIVPITTSSGSSPQVLSSVLGAPSSSILGQALQSSNPDPATTGSPIFQGDDKNRRNVWNTESLRTALGLT
jgi:hypothetical protein